MLVFIRGIFMERIGTTPRRWVATAVCGGLLVLSLHPGDGCAQDYLRVDRGPPITCEPSYINLGTILDSLDVTVSAVIKNTSAQPVHITDVVANCSSCFRYELDRTHLAPGESALLELVFDPWGIAGDLQLMVAVVTGDPSQPQGALQIDARIEPAYRVSGGPVAFFKVIEGFPRTWRLTLEPQIALDDPLDQVVSAMDGFSGTVEFDEDKDRYVVDITAGGDLPPGKHMTLVTVQSSTGTAPPCLIPVGATVQETFLVVPDRLILTRSPKEQLRMIILEHHLSPPLRVTGVELPGSNCRYRLTREEDLSKTWIKVYFQDVARLGGQGTIVIHTNHADYPTIEVPVLTQDLASVIVEPDCPAARRAAQQQRLRRR